MMSTSKANVTNFNSEVCLNRNFGKSIVDCSKCFDLNNIDSWHLHLHALLVVATTVMTLAGNGLVFILLLKYKKLRNRTSVISVSLILANTGLVAGLHFPVIVSTLIKGWMFKFVGCKIFGFVSIQFTFTRWLNMGVLAFDRFCAVRFPFSYPSHSRFILVILLSMTWILPILLGSSVIDGYASVVFRENFPSCIVYAPEFGRGLILFSIAFSFSFLVGGTLPVVLYSWLFYKAIKLNGFHFNMMRTNNNSVSRSTISHSIRERIFSERKAIVTFALIFLAFSLTAMPQYTIEMLWWIHIDTWCSIPYSIHLRITELYLLATAIDPFAVMRENDFRKRLKHLLCCHNNCGRYNTNRSIISALPPERDFDAIRSMAERALSLVSLSSSRDNLDSTDINRMPYRPRSGSAPAAYQRPCTAGRIKIFDAVEEEEEEPCEENAHVCSSSASVSSDGDKGDFIVDEEFETKLVYGNVKNRDCVEVSISFSD